MAQASQASGNFSTREVILNEAARIFAERGFHGTGIAELEKAVGIKRGALYYHIRSKEALLFELSIRHVRELIDTAREIIGREDDPVIQLRDLARAHLRRVGERYREAVVWQRESHALGGKLATQVQLLRDEYEQLFTSIIATGVEQGVFRSASPIVVKGLLGLLGYTYLWMKGEGPLTPEEIADELIDLILVGEFTEHGRTMLATGPN